MKKVLVTGGAGYIGSHVTVQLATAGYDVSILDDLSNSSISSIHNVEKILGRELQWYNCDILDNRCLFDVFNELNPEVVIHLAGRKSVSESFSKPIQYYETNFCGTLNILRAMDAINCKQILFSSTATVYGPCATKCIENSDLLPMQPYGRSKLMSESLIRDWTANDLTKKAIVFRYFNPLGAHQSGLIGEDPAKEPGNIMPLLMRAALEQTVFKIFGNDYQTSDGTGVRDYIHVMDIANAHLSALSSNDTSFNIFNLGIGVGTSVLQLVRTFEKVAGVEVRKEFVERRQGDIAYSCADPSRAFQQLQWTPKYDVTQMCKDSWRFIKLKNNFK